jgi:oligosaccharide translocation protein RFT1
MLSTVLFLGREGFRLALIKSTTTATASRGSAKYTENIHISNVAWLSIPTGIVLSLFCLVVHLYHCQLWKDNLNGSYTQIQQNFEEWQDYRIAGMLYCLAASIETLAEPLVILFAMRDLDVQTRTTAEVIATFAKSITVVTLLSSSSSIIIGPNHSSKNPKFPVTIFGIGQVLYALLFTSIFYYQKWTCITWPLLQQKHNLPTTKFHWPTVKLSAYFTLQGIFKHFLTEGDRIILTTLAHSYDQGIYAMAQAYGGIVSRLLFQPLEENARLLFSRQHRSIMEQQQQQQRKSVVSTTAIHQQQRQHLTTVAAKNDELEDTFCLLVKFVLYISLLSCMASNYTSILLRILVCSKWTTTQYSTATNNNSPSAVLSAFCYYTSLLALNGMTEAFVYGVVTQSEDVGKLGFVHGCVGCIFAVTAPMLVKRYQTVGLVIANGLSMILRSTYSLVFAAGRKTFCLNHFSFGFAFLCLFLSAIIYCFSKYPLTIFFFKFT